MKQTGHILIFLILFSVSALAQTFTGSTSAIPDYSLPISFYIMVPALDSAQLSSSFGLKKICIDISHPRVSDLAIYLAAPDGTQIDLVDGAGGSDSNFTGTCFSMSASVTIFSGTAPFTGTYYPRHNIGELNDGQSGIGVWRLIVQDLVRGDSGVVNSWSLTFDTVAPVPRSTPTGPCNQFNAAGCGCADSTQQNCWLVPDMFIGHEWFTDTIHRREFHDSITVSNSTANIGYGPMEIIGTGQWFCGDSAVSGSGLCPNGTYAKQLVKQRIYVKNQTGIFTFVDSSVGTMSFHAELGHHHLHVDDWTENTLRIRGPESDPSRWPIIGTGYKNSMNLYDHVKCDQVFVACDYGNTVYDLYGLRNGGLGLGYNSGSPNVQGISVGYADIYEYLLPYGQAIYFDSVCNGDYVLLAQFDPKGRFIDMRPENNITYFTVSLTKQTPGCCRTRFDIDTISYTGGLFRFIDRSVAMPMQWHWDFGDGDTSSEQFPYHQYATVGIHTVSLTTMTSQGCGGTDTFVITVPQNLSTPSLPLSPLSVSVYPNPSQGRFTLTCAGEMLQDVHVAAYDMLGQSVACSVDPITVLPAERSLSITLHDKGVYTLRITSGTRVFYQKITIF